MLSVSNDESGIAIKRYGMKNEKKKEEDRPHIGKKTKTKKFNIRFVENKFNK